MNKLLILVLLVGSLFADDKLGNLKNAANSLFTKDKWDIVKTEEISVYTLKNIKDESLMLTCDKGIALIGLLGSDNKSYTTDNIIVSLNGKKSTIFPTMLYKNISSEEETHNFNYFLHELTDANNIFVKAENNMFIFTPKNSKDLINVFEDCYIKSASEEKGNTQTNNQVSESKDFWENGWHQGNSMYHISNKNNDRLEIACNFEGGSIDLMDSEIGLGGVINVIFDNERKIITPTSISINERTSGDDTAWGNFMYWLQNSKHFVIEAENGKKYTFEPVNSQKILEGIVESCTEYIGGM